jgi:hypothetical protein
MVYRPSLTEEQVVLWDSQVAELRMAVERWTGNVSSGVLLWHQDHGARCS